MTSRLLHLALFAVICLAFSSAPQAMAQDAAPAADDPPALTQEELDQLLAPIALYPDSLLSQMFMASTYPLEIVEAERWVKANASLEGDALAKALEGQTWDPSVKSLVNFPDVLTMMSEKLDFTTKLGDAVLSQQEQVMATVQSLRAKAQEQGNLQSSEQQVVKVETQTIVIESVSPQVVYVPQYNPVVVYGTWPYPAYPPYPYHPPGYVASNVVSFTAGVALGAAWGYAWGGCNWGRGDIDINVNRNTNFNTNINRSNYSKVGGAGGSWKHDNSHRRGAPYRNSSTARQHGGRSAGQVAQQRDAYRGRNDRGGAGTNRPAGGNRSTAGRDRPAAGGNRPAAGRDRPSGGNRPKATTGGRGGNALSGSGRSGSNTRAASSRGSSSRSGGSASRSRGSAGRSRGGSRGGGGRR